MYTAYKIKQERERPDGDFDVTLDVYEGDYTTEEELDDYGNLSNVYRFRRTGKVKRVRMIRSKVATKAEAKALYDGEQDKDKTRTPIDGQKVGA